MSRRRAAVPSERDADSPRGRPIDDPPSRSDQAEGRLVGYRLIRRVATGERADLFLAAAEEPLAPSASGDETNVASRVDGPSGPPLVILRVYSADSPDDTIALEIGAMSSDATGTLPMLHDVANLDDGRCALAVERLGGPPLSRLLAERTLTPGEAVTILAPLVVAVAELARHGYVHSRLAASDVLIDDRGRPRLVGLGALRRLPERSPVDRTALRREAHLALAELISDVGAAVRPAGALDAVMALLRDRLAERPFRPCEAEMERRLFDIALAEPIRGLSLPGRPAPRLPARVVDSGESLAQSDDDAAGTAPDRVPSAFARTMLELAQIPGAFASRRGVEADADRLGASRRHLRELARAKGRTLTVGGLVGGAALVLLLTLVPPATANVAGDAGADGGRGTRSTVPDPRDAATSGAATQVPAPPPEQPETDSPAPSAGEGAPSDPGPLEAAAALLERRAECFQTLDLACLDEVVQAGSVAESEDRAALTAAREGGTPPDVEFDVAAISVTTEMGGAVLVTAPRRSAEREPASLLVVRGEAGWRLREIFG